MVTPARVAKRSGANHMAEVILGANYPREAPRVRWLAPIFHPNISASGVVCLGGYGTHVRETAELFMRLNLIQIIASDGHSPRTRAPEATRRAVAAAGSRRSCARRSGRLAGRAQRSPRERLAPGLWQLQGVRVVAGRVVAGRHAPCRRPAETAARWGRRSGRLGGWPAGPHCKSRGSHPRPGRQSGWHHRLRPPGFRPTSGWEGPHATLTARRERAGCSVQTAQRP